MADGVWRVATSNACVMAPWNVWFKVSVGTSHHHSDLSSVWVRDGATGSIADPGTGTYNGPLSVRNGFRSSAGHPVWVPEGQDLLQPYRAFRWLRTAHGFGGVPVRCRTERSSSAGTTPSKATESRPGWLGPSSWMLSGSLSSTLPKGPGTETWEMTVPIAPGASEASFFGLDAARLDEGSEQPFSGWHSPTYGDGRPSVWMRLASASDSWPVWGVGAPPRVEKTAEVSASRVPLPGPLGGGDGGDFVVGTGSGQHPRGATWLKPLGASWF